MEISAKSTAGSGLGPLLAFVAAGLAVIGVDFIDGSRYMVDVDDRMRALQIRDLLADGDWFDRTLPFVATPKDYVSPWSRLVDLPYVVTVKALSPVMGEDAAMALAVNFWPLLLFVLFAMLAVRVMRLAAGQGPRPLHAAIAAVPMVFALWNFVPGRIDHHNVQLVLMLAMLAGLADPRPVRGGVLAGIAATLSIEVGLECLPYIAGGFGALALLAAIRGGGGPVARLRACGLGFALSALPVAYAFSSPPTIFVGACDAMSGFWITVILLCGAVAAIVPALWRLRYFSTPARRVTSLVVAGILYLIVIAVALPQCLWGPYVVIDGVTRAVWFDRLDQEASAAVLFENGALGILGVMLVYIVILGFAWQPMVRRLRAGNPAALLVWIVAAASVALAFAKLRALPFPSAFVALLLPIVLSELSAETIRRRLLPAAAVPLVLAGLAAPFFPASEPIDAVDLMIGDQCEGEDFSVLERVPPGRILNGLALGVPIAEHGTGHTVAAVPFHRASPGMRRLAFAFIADTLVTRKSGLTDFDYLAICRRDPAIDLTATPLFDALQRSRSVPGIVAIEPEGSSRFRLYRLDHDAPDAFALPDDVPWPSQQRF